MAGEQITPPYYSHTWHELFPFIPKSLARVLDIGCGAGNFGHELKNRYNCQVWGIEPNGSAAMEAARKLDVSINKIFAEDMPELHEKNSMRYFLTMC
jgi:cyclopropane fatty-acyl-phospholipid synthase-like methyltransferase